jgi:sulfite reductase (NADPH) flavoprotein alpha-component
MLQQMQQSSSSKTKSTTKSTWFSVLGFGSHAYPEFCRIAYKVNNAAKEDWANPLLEIHTVNDKSPVEFENYTNVLSQN